jgi:hypothetical protein
MKIENDGDEVDKFFSLVDDLERDELIQRQVQRKKLLKLKFISSPKNQPIPKEIKLLGNRIIFGSKEGGDV